MVLEPQSSINFDVSFSQLTGWEEPFPWQRTLFTELTGKLFRDTYDIPTGLGKTSIIAIWLLALAHHVRADTLAGYPIRLVYVVNRRTVVDQATREAEQLREALAVVPELRTIADALKSLAVRPSVSALAISTLRGQFADNAEWRDDPARPAVIIGTVDMIGSRLLFSGYGRGYKSRPLHAGFLGQDALLVHDEAHIEPAFQELVDSVQLEQHRCHDFRPFRVIALTATARSGGNRFQLGDADRDHPVVKKRIGAEKWIEFRRVADEQKIEDEVTRCALRHSASGQAILLFLRKLDHVDKVKADLRKANLPVQVLTGTMRGLERDALATADPIFARFMPRTAVTPHSGTVYLVCTSAGEVGVNISADHLVCDLTPFDSMAQRFGRVNRFGNGNACIDVVHESTRDAKKKDDRYEQARWITLELLRSLPHKAAGHDASPAALGELPADERQAAFTPPPEILPVSDILFDAWALTSVREKLPGRPPVADWLHGVAEWEPPETHLAWREEVERLKGEALTQYKPRDLLDDYPLKPHELLRDQTSRVFAHLETIAERCPDLFAWIDSGGEVRVLSLRELLEKNRQKKPVVNLDDCTVLLPPAAGGLGFSHEGRSTGMLDGNATFDETRRADYDVADKPTNGASEPSRCRVWDDDEVPAAMRLVRTIDLRSDAVEEYDEDEDDEDEQQPHRFWRWYVRPRSADDEGSRTAREVQELKAHLQSAEQFAIAIVTKVGLRHTEATAVTLAAGLHDLGKHRKIWQRSIRNTDYPDVVLAKSGGRMWPLDLNDYRHELGSLIDVAKEADLGRQTPEVQDLTLHLIAAHHGRARPHFPAGETFDPERSDRDVAEAIREVPRRFARLQRKYGRWGLAYLESLVRAADALASQGSEAMDSAAIESIAKPRRGKQG